MKRKHKILLMVFGLMIAFFSYVMVKILVFPPNVDKSKIETSPSVQYEGDLSWMGNNWLKKNQYGMWELYLEGKPFERGLAFGKLTQSLNAAKEKAFVSEIHQRVPSDFYFTFLKYLVGWFNRDLEANIPLEFDKEIYGASFFMSDDYDFIAPKYHRSLNYHAAHDIGHALQNLNMVGCTSFAVKNKMADSVGNLLIARNFDFYFGEEFAKDKIVAFVKPDSGYAFMSLTWASFSGVVSGMNEKGLTVTLNSAKSGPVFKAKTPVSIIGRHILQYAATIQEAYEIAESYHSFVAETFLIGSAVDNDFGLIEKSQDETVLYKNGKDRLVVTNHYQSDELKDEPNNVEYMAEGVSQYRYKRVEELLDKQVTITPQVAAEILRDQLGLDSADLGMGNEKAINQLIAHHGIIFQPHQLRVWVAAAPYQLGAFVCYDLNKIFHSDIMGIPSQPVGIDSLTIEADPFLQTKDYEKYQYYLRMADKLSFPDGDGVKYKITDEEVERFIESNPISYLPYYYLGDYFLSGQEYARAIDMYEKGLARVVAKRNEKIHMEIRLATCKEQLQQ